MRTIDLILSCADTALNLLFAYWMFDCLWTRESNKRKHIGLILFSCIVCIALFRTIGNANVQSLFGLFPLFALTLCFDAKGWQRILFCSIFFAVACTSKIMVELIAESVLNTDYTVAGYFWYNMQITLISKLLVFAFVAGVRIKQKIVFFKNARKYYLLIPIFLFVSVSILVLQYYVFPDFPFEIQSLYIVVMICFTVLIIAGIMMFAFLDLSQQNLISQNNLAAANELIKKQLDQYRTLEKHHNEIAKLRHDHQNFCIGVLNELENNQTSAVIARLKEECAFMQNDKKDVGDIIYSVVEIKSDRAKEQDISIDFEYRNPKQLEISPLDLAVILGNALDNAIEATASLDNQSKKTVSVLVAIKNNTVVIKIKNPVSRKIDLSRLTTHKTNASQHGFGILSMRQLAAKYKGEVLFDCTDDTFSVLIILDNASA